MLDVLVASRPTMPARRSWPATLASAVLHGGLVTLGFLATRRPPAPLELPADPPVVHWTAASAAGSVRPSGLPQPGPVLQLPGALILPGAAPLPGDLPPVPGIPWAERLPWGLGQPGDTAGTTTIRADTPPEAMLADEPPVLLTHPPLQYPELLRQAGIEGAVLVEAVLDTLGRVEPASLRIARGAHPLFEREAMAVVLASRYRPARIGTRVVRVHVRVPVTFTMRR